MGLATPGSENDSSSPAAEIEASDRKVRAELDRRITEFACYPDGTFGPLNGRDLIVIVILFIALPLVLVWSSR